MVKKLSKYGNSMALIIDKPILELLNIKEDTPLKITTDGKAIIIIPEGPARTHKERVKDAAEEAMDKYAEALQKLAD
jgi:putative addiction module antidote